VPAQSILLQLAWRPLALYAPDVFHVEQQGMAVTVWLPDQLGAPTSWVR
jgi:hypothetical protein